MSPQGLKTRKSEHLRELVVRRQSGVLEEIQAERDHLRQVLLSAPLFVCVSHIAHTGLPNCA
eukprot:CAMPEP_0198718500 /NCGR_PEP_ID=MMETSP1471-20131121/50997_1 /TAXON_ID=41880 /ORGANISM="Pycnococcus provasolii, Strain RCC733" /LENGTH=61 /DNA_ID=CAMNT_0044479181 /DNA_START=86 /DNA_END=267 /DNA_ORIENTATION=+